MNKFNRTPLIGLGLLGALVAIGAFACSSSTTNNGVTPDGGKAGDGGGGSDSPVDMTDGPSTTDGPDMSDGGTDAPVVTSAKNGAIFLSQTRGAAAVTSTIGAGFSDVAPATNPATMTMTIGGCEVADTDTTPVDAGAPADAGPPPASPSAGDITLTGG